MQIFVRGQRRFDAGLMPEPQQLTMKRFTHARQRFALPAHRTAFRTRQAAQHPQQRGFPGAVIAGHLQEFTWPDRQGQRLEQHPVIEDAAQSLCMQHECTLLGSDRR